MKLSHFSWRDTVDGYEGAACAYQLFVDDGGVANTPYTFGQVKAMYDR